MVALGGQNNRPAAPHLRDLENLAHDRPAQVDLFYFGDKHPLDGFLDVVGHLVDDVVAADLDLLFVGESDRAVFRGNAEADDDGL